MHVLHIYCDLPGNLYALVPQLVSRRRALLIEGVVAEVAERGSGWWGGGCQLGSTKKGEDGWHLH